jgi:hypothetical protein
MTDKKKLTWTSKTISAGNNSKTVKGDEEYLTAIMYMAPYKLSGVGNLCSMAELAKCHEPCLNLSGRGIFNNVQKARIRKSKWYFEDRKSFMDQLYKDVERFKKFCEKNDVMPAVRLNGTSDVRWELIKDDEGKCIFERFPDITFYDYTKIYNRKVTKYKNYHLTWSYSEANPKYQVYFKEAKKAKMNIAVVFRDDKFPRKFLNWKVINGDADDLRFLDPKNSIVGLKAKGPAKKDTSGFVVDTRV